MPNQLPDVKVYFLSDGSNYGQFSVVDNTILARGALAVLTANNIPNKLVRIGNFIGSNIVQVVDVNTGIFVDISPFTVSRQASIEMLAQNNNVPINRSEFATQYKILSSDGSTSTLLTQESNTLTFKDQTGAVVTTLASLVAGGSRW